MWKKNKMQYTSDITQPFTALYLYLLLDSRVSPSVKLIRHFPKLLWFITIVTDKWSYLCERNLLYLCYMKGLLYSILLQLLSHTYVGSLLHILCLNPLQIPGNSFLSKKIFMERWLLGVPTITKYTTHWKSYDTIGQHCDAVLDYGPKCMVGRLRKQLHLDACVRVWRSWFVTGSSYGKFL